MQDRKQRGNQVVKKEDNWLDAIIIAAVAVFAFLLGTVYGKGLRNLQWETLLAGAMGLIGGAFAWFSAQSQIKAQKEQRKEDIRREEEMFNYTYYEEMLFKVKLVINANSDLRKRFPNNSILQGSTLHQVKHVFERIKIPTPPHTAKKEIKSDSLEIGFKINTLINIIDDVENSIDEIDKTIEDIETKEKAAKKDKFNSYRGEINILIASIETTGQSILQHCKHEIDKMK